MNDTHPWVMSWYPKKQNAGNIVMKNVCVPSEDVLTKYVSKNGLRTRSYMNCQQIQRMGRRSSPTCILAIIFDSQANVLPMHLLIPARHQFIVRSYTSSGNMPMAVAGTSSSPSSDSEGVEPDFESSDTVEESREDICSGDCLRGEL